MFNFIGPSTSINVSIGDPDPETKVVSDLTEFRGITTSPPIVLLVVGDGILYYLDATDTTSADNGASVIVVTVTGARYKQAI